MKKLLYVLPFLLATPAISADMPVKAPSSVRAPIVDGGWYMGVAAGGVFGDSSAVGLSASPEGYLASVILGRDYYNQNHLLRLEGEIGLASAKDSTFFGIANAELNALAMLRAGYGYRFENGFTPFLTVGGYWANHTISVIGISDTQNHFGFTAGVGAEVQLRDRWKLRAEYIHLFDKSDTYSLIGASFKGNFEADIYRLAATYTF